MAKLNTPDELLIGILVSEELNISVSPSASVATTVPIAVWFSSAVKVADEVITGELSLRLFILTTILFSDVV